MIHPAALRKVFRLPPRNTTVVRPPAPPTAPAQKINWAYMLETFYNNHYGIQEEGAHWGHWVTDEVWASLNCYKPRKQGYFHPSTGLYEGTEACIRSVMFDLMMAKRSKQPLERQRMPMRLDAGSNRHIGLHVAFLGMAHYKWMGVQSYRYEVPVAHKTLPLKGSVDGIVTMRSGKNYVLDFKTKADKPWKALRQVERGHAGQLQTYEGLLQEPNGAVLYENKDNQQVAPYSVKSDPRTTEEAERFMRKVLVQLGKKKLPKFAEGVCAANKMFCAYISVCDKHRAGATFDSLDGRDAFHKEWHRKGAYE